MTDGPIGLPYLNNPTQQQRLDMDKTYTFNPKDFEESRGTLIPMASKYNTQLIKTFQ